MALIIEDETMERLAEQLAVAEGVSVAEVVRESLLSLARQRGLRTRKLPLRERLAALAQEVDALPPRSPADPLPMAKLSATPHIHGKYQEHEAIVAIPDGEILEGSAPTAKMKLLQAWIELHKTIWRRSGNWR